ncbi:hypothetical protein V8E36_005954 [Tilletia maclaganii]
MPAAGRQRVAKGGVEGAKDGADAKKKRAAIKSKGKGKSTTASSTTAFLTLPPLVLQGQRQRRKAEHDQRYHVPLLLSQADTQDSLLDWFDSVRTTREMAWRKDWVDPHSLSVADRSRRAYEVLVSETMLQQTRVDTVKTYYADWMERFPTVRALTEAKADDVMAAWRGLGYYSRATRLQTAAKTVHEKYAGVLPSDPIELEREIAGVGRYTAGAISSIVFGVATPLLDGNVARVLSRQMGLHADVKSKSISDVLWRAAELLVISVSTAQSKKSSAGEPARKRREDEDEPRPSATPGRWNQALMELGSTICTPYPRCESCPIRQTCRAYNEAKALEQRPNPSNGTRSNKSTGDVSIEDIESLCSMCEPMPSLEEELSELSDEEVQESRAKRKRKDPSSKDVTATPSGSKLRQSTLSFAPPPPRSQDADSATNSKGGPSQATDAAEAGPSKIVLAHVRQFPLKVAKKKVREEDAVICIIEARKKGHASNGSSGTKTTSLGKRKSKDGRRDVPEDSLFLIRQRPDKGLLASMWEMPTCIYDDEDADRTAEDRMKSARAYTLSTLKKVGLPDGQAAGNELLGASTISRTEMLGLHTHVFSHLKMHMHTVHLVLEVDDDVLAGASKALPEGVKWVHAKALEEDYSMGNGMRTCWAMLTETP